MDATETHLAATPRDSRWPATNLPSSPKGFDNASPRLHERQNVRLRPSDMLEHAEPLSPLNLSLHSEVPRRPSKMSLFSLFSRPKVEKQRGYTERDLPATATKEANGSTPITEGQIPPEHIPARPASIASVKTTATKSSKGRSKVAHAPPPVPAQKKERKSTPFEPPPLFQAFPQATKDGKLEVSYISVETLNKEKIKSNGTVNAMNEKATGDRSSVETRRTSALKYIPNGSAAAVELPKKIFILVTSGYLLQYAETGSSERLPEKILHLGKESAAFACDLVPGKHYVLQVSQAVDRDGIIVVNSGSIFSRLGMRSAAAKRMTSNFVMVLPNAVEMESWMTAIRQEIDILGGKKATPEIAKSSVSDLNSSTPDLLKRTPSHRYQVKRDPSRVTPASSPRPDQTTFVPVPTNVERDKSESAPIDGVGSEANKLDDSITKSAMGITLLNESNRLLVPPTVLVEQHQLAPLEDDTGDVLAPPLQPEITFSLQSNQGPHPPATSPQNPLQTESGISQRKDTSPAPPNFSTSRRKGPPAPLLLHSQTLRPARSSIIEESPIIPNYPVDYTRSSNRLTNSHSEPDFQASKSNNNKHDSKVPSPLPLSSIDGFESEDADSVGMLPTPSSLSSSRVGSPGHVIGKRHSMSTIESNKTRRVASFSMPLKINPSTTQGTPSAGNPRRHSRMDDPARRSNLPVGLALTPPADAVNPYVNSYFEPEIQSPLPDAPQKSISNSLNGRLSLFPSPTPSPIPVLPDHLKRTSSFNSRQSYSHPGLIGGAVKRPTSMQVRPDHAPFLTSVRNSSVPLDLYAARTTVPIRSMKPSRSSTNLEVLRQQQSSQEAFKALKFHLPIWEETKNSSIPVSDAIAAPVVPKAGSRTSMRKSQQRLSSLPNLDFGIPVVGLGPPAPPPQAPLPPPPPSRPTSSDTLHDGSSVIDRAVGLGISVS